VRAAVRSVAALRQTRNTLRAPARQHLIARLAADAELPAQLRHRCFATLAGHAKPCLLFHRTGLQPCHRPNLQARTITSDLFPILPVYSVTHHPGLDQSYPLPFGGEDVRPWLTAACAW